MKSLLSVLFIFAITLNLKSQSADKNFRIGLTATPNISWMSNLKKEMQYDGLSVGFGYGLQVDYRLGKNLFFSSGLGIHTYGGKLKSNENETLFLSYQNDNDEAVSNQFVSRKYNFQTVTVPFTLRMLTEEIGYIKYFGQFGVNLGYTYRGITTKNNVNINNDVVELSGDNNEEMILGEEVFPFQMDLTVGLGGQYNLVGNTDLLIGFNYTSGILRALKKESSSIFEDASNTNGVQQLVSRRGVLMTVGIIF